MKKSTNNDANRMQIGFQLIENEFNEKDEYITTTRSTWLANIYEDLNTN